MTKEPNGDREVLEHIRTTRARQRFLPNDDREALIDAMKRGEKVRQAAWSAYGQEPDGEGVKPYSDNWYRAEALMAAGFSRATVPDAATDGDYHEGLEEGIKIGRAERDAATGNVQKMYDRACADIQEYGETIKRLEAERDTANEYAFFARQTLAEVEEERDAALAAVERVRVIHARDEHGLCVACSWEYPETSYDALDHDVPWPCPTVAALDGAPEPEWEREYRRVRPDGVPVFNAVFESLPVLDDYYTAEYRTVSPWLQVEGESKP